jgi:hypothetical protein
LSPNRFATAALKITTERNGNSEELDDVRFDSRRIQIFVFLRNIQTGPVTHTASYSIGTGSLFWRQSGWGLRLATYLHQAFKLTAALQHICSPSSLRSVQILECLSEDGVCDKLAPWDKS